MVTFVLNTDYCGVGFTLSYAALKRLGWHRDARYPVLDIDMRSNPELVRVCKELGSRASADGKPFTFVDVASADIPFVKLTTYDGIEFLTIDNKEKQRAAQEQIISATHAVLTCSHLSDTEKISLLKTILK